MKRHNIKRIALTGMSFFMIGGMALAANNPASNPNHPSSMMMRQPATSQSGQSPPANQATTPSSMVDDIRDIRGPLHIPDPLTWLYYAGGACLFLIAAVAALKWLRRQKALRAKLAFEIAFDQLERAKALMTPEKADEFSVAVSDAIRTYIEKRFEVRVTRHTTEEFMIRITADPSGDLREYADLLHDFLGHCDLAKFARYMLTVDQMKEMHQSAWGFVDKTRPQPEEKTADRKSKISEEYPMVTERLKASSLLGLLWEKSLRRISKKTMMPEGLGTRSAIAAGGR